MKTLEKIISNVKGLKKLARIGLVGLALAGGAREANADWLDNYTPPPGFTASRVTEEQKDIRALVYNDINPNFLQGIYYSTEDTIYFLPDSGERQVFADIGADDMAFSAGGAFEDSLYITKRHYPTNVSTIQKIDTESNIYYFGEQIGSNRIVISQGGTLGEFLFASHGADIVKFSPSGQMETFVPDLGAYEFADLVIGLGGDFGTDLYVLDRYGNHLWRIGQDGSPALFIDDTLAASIAFSSGGIFGNYLYTDDLPYRLKSPIYRLDSFGNPEPFGSGEDQYYDENFDFKGTEALYISAGNSIYKVIPEPSTLALLCLGGIALFRRKELK